MSRDLVYPGMRSHFTDLSNRITMFTGTWRVMIIKASVICQLEDQTQLCDRSSLDFYCSCSLIGKCEYFAMNFPVLV